MEGGTGRPTNLIVIDASTVVGAALVVEGVPRQAIRRARTLSGIAMSDRVAAEIQNVLSRPKFARILTPVRQAEIADLLFTDAQWFNPVIAVTDCRDPTDNIYLELALTAQAVAIVSSDNDLLVLDQWRGIRIIRPVQFLALPLP